MAKLVTATIKKYWNLISVGFLWFCVWATYNTDVSRIFSHGFPNNNLDMIHGLRSLLPFLALPVSVIIIFKKRLLSKNIFLTPLGLLGVFAMVGIFSSLFSKNPLFAFYWGLLYITVIIVMLAFMDNKDLIKKIIVINLVIAGIIAISLVLFFLVQPGVINSITFNFLICSERPFEGIANIQAGANTFDMAGSRPTGLGRYAGVVAIVALASFFYSKKSAKTVWFFIFIIFLFILLFSKGRTEIIAFIMVAFFIVWSLKKINFLSIISLCAIFLLSIFLIFYDVPCNNSSRLVSFFTNLIPINHSVVSKNYYQNGENSIDILKSKTAITPLSEPTTARDIKNIITLSGRASGVWQDAGTLFLSSPIFGHGFQSDRFFLNGQHAHNSVIHALIQTGILGTIPFILAFILIFIILVRLFKNSQIDQKEKNFLTILSAVLLFFAIRSITESVAFFSADWLFVAPIIAYIQCFDSKVKKGKSDAPQMNFRDNKIDIIKASDLVEKIKYWIKNESQKMHWVVVTGMHGIVEAERHADFKYIINSADIWVPDGISLVWLAKLKGFFIEKRVSGADLMLEFFKISGKEKFKNYFYGDTEDTLKKLKEKFPNISADFYSPPFRELTDEEDNKIIEKINQAKPDILWVGLGLPKQEKWIFKHKEKLKVPVVIGVGAAFKFLSGKVKRAPSWMGNVGLEWFWRLLHEPKTVWKRIFIDVPFFVWLVLESFFYIDFKKKIIESNRLAAGRILSFIERNFLFPIGVFIGPALLKQLTPYDANGFEEKIRLGNLSDGGYVVPRSILPLIEVVYCYGVADHIDFEEDLVRHIKIPIRFYDHTVSGLPSKNNSFSFKKQGIAGRKYGSFDTFHNHLIENNDENKKILLKLDVEGAEWGILEKIIDESSENILAIILEIHKLYKYSRIMSYIRVLEKINSKFTLVHLHGNNYCKSFIIGGKEISDALELTLINNNLIRSKSVMRGSLPSDKDYPNLQGRRDLPLDFWKK